MERILVIRLSAMGDVLLTTPVIRWLKHRFPDSTIDFLVKRRFAPILANNPYVDHVLAFDSDGGGSELIQRAKEIRASKYTRVLDLQTNPRSILLGWLSNAPVRRFYPGRWKRYHLVRFKRFLNDAFAPIPLRMLKTLQNWGVKDDGLGLDFVLDADVRSWAEKQRIQTGWQEGDPYLIIAPSAGRKTKRWPEERFTEVGIHFHKQGFRIGLVGGTSDDECCDRVAASIHTDVLNLAGRATLQQTAAFIEGSHLLITNDTGVMHMGAAVNSPILAVFGPTSEHLGFFPFRAESIIVEKKMNCRPCSYHGTDECPIIHFKCMLEIPSDDVILAAENLLKECL